MRTRRDKERKRRRRVGEERVMTWEASRGLGGDGMREDGEEEKGKGRIRDLRLLLQLSFREGEENFSLHPQDVRSSRPWSLLGQSPYKSK